MRLQCLVERRIFQPDALPHKEPRRVERLRQEKASHGRLLRLGKGNRLRGESFPFCIDVIGNKGGDPQDFRYNEFYRSHSVHAYTLHQVPSASGQGHCRRPNPVELRSELVHVGQAFDFVQKRKLRPHTLDGATKRVK